MQYEIYSIMGFYKGELKHALVCVHMHMYKTHLSIYWHIQVVACICFLFVYKLLETIGE